MRKMQYVLSQLLFAINHVVNALDFMKLIPECRNVNKSE